MAGGRCVTSGWSPPPFFKNWENWSLQEKKNGDFSLLDQANNNFLEKETCKV